MNYEITPFRETDLCGIKIAITSFSTDFYFPSIWYNFSGVYSNEVIIHSLSLYYYVS